MAMQKEGRSVRSPCFPVPGAPQRGRSEENPDFRSVQLVLRGVSLLPAGLGEILWWLRTRVGRSRAGKTSTSLRRSTKPQGGKLPPSHPC